ncbi:response regulator [Mastigocoleus sp. MO_188.B34]|uniref:response regulator n=1 Tax=Mastigocoleus sp. MO_188.B34 TaxID=3036635 RepID=UPI00262C9CF2|nr:response regulator [Mastigocoleus sp. MO_188.B34]MDJ0694613.1 response regulator [Mastigocoleus sp. MO_188.B34]
MLITNNRPINILLVEDDEVDIMNVQRAFKKGNILNPLFIAKNGLEALNMLRDTKDNPAVVPHERRLILLDLNMPKMGGIEFLQNLRSDDDLKSIPVVVLTTSNQDRDLVEAYNLNVAGYLIKPVQFAHFVDLMTTLNKYWSFSEIPN